ncbi:MAG: hypothetical protein IJG05_04105 [Solobacterium sp.]|nr:hypothetical protein [Solobacterium sp.]MBQ6592975.1 hypothetical protein [Solobacterium sp.]
MFNSSGSWLVYLAVCLLLNAVFRFIGAIITKSTSSNKKIPEYIVCASVMVAVIAHCLYLSGWLSFLAAAGVRTVVLLLAGMAGITNVGTPLKPVQEHIELIMFSALLMFASLFSLIPAYITPIILLQFVLAAMLWYFLKSARMKA